MKQKKWKKVKPSQFTSCLLLLNGHLFESELWNFPTLDMKVEFPKCWGSKPKSLNSLLIGWMVPREIFTTRDFKLFAKSMRKKNDASVEREPTNTNAFKWFWSHQWIYKQDSKNKFDWKKYAQFRFSVRFINKSIYFFLTKKKWIGLIRFHEYS